MTKVLYTKPFILLQEQMEQLKLRGLKFTDEAKALHLLKYISYYRFALRIGGRFCVEMGVI